MPQPVRVNSAGKGYIFAPELEQCRRCAKAFENCSNLDFEHMPTRRREDAFLTVRVLCMGFKPRKP